MKPNQHPYSAVRSCVSFLFAGSIFCASSVSAATVLLDFESETLASNTPPSGWNLVTTTYSQVTPTYAVGAGAAGAGQGGYVTARSSNRWLSGAYITNSGMAAFDVKESITGTFKFYIDAGSSANYKSVQFFFGDLASGLTGTSGQVLGAHLERNTFGNRAGVSLGTGVAPTSLNRLDSNLWYNASFTWTPTSGTTGDFSLSVTGAHNWVATITGYTFDSDEAFFAFGTSGYATNAGTGRFDDISIQGTELINIIPEPSVALLGGLGTLLLLRRRR